MKTLVPIPWLAATLCLFFTSASAPAQNNSVFLTNEQRIPSRFEVIRDDLGFYWQLTNAGSFYDMGANAFKSANVLSVNGQKFAAQRFEKPGEHRFQLESQDDSLHIIRDIWIDAERSGARYLEIFRNRSESELTLKVDLNTEFRFPIQETFSRTGRIASTLPTPDPTAALFKFNAIDGFPDYLVLAGSQRGEVQPTIITASSKRNALISWELTLPPGESASVLHWCGQRTIVQPTEIPDEFAAFYQSNRLIRPEIPESEFSSLQNFPLLAAENPPVEATRLSELIQLNQFLRQLGTQRHGAETLWLDAENQLLGDIEPSTTLKIGTRAGERSVPFAEIAAWDAGTPSRHQLFLRNGEVLQGPVTVPAFRMTGPDGWEMGLDAAAFETLLFRVQATDGEIAENTWGFVETTSGETIPVNADEGTILELATTWGKLPLPLGEIRAVHRIQNPFPRHHMILENGDQLVGFLTGPALTTGGSDVAPPEIAALWSAGNHHPEVDALFSFSQLWEEERPGIHLEGGTRISGNLITEALTLRTAGPSASFVPSEVETLRRTDDGILDQEPEFEVLMQNGNLLKGHLEEHHVRIRFQGEVLEVPTLQLLGLRTAQTE